MQDSGIANNIFLVSKKHEKNGDKSATTTNFEQQLVRKAAEGDKQAFDELYRMFSGLVHGIVLARVPYSDAEDLVQEVFVSAYRSLSGLRDESAFGPWLVRIARNKTSEYFRRLRKTEELTDEFDQPHVPIDEANEALRVIASLPDTYSETLILRLVEGMTGPEIAIRTGLTEASVRVNLHRGMKMLRAKLGAKRGKGQ